jgi:hypothetical protein
LSQDEKGGGRLGGNAISNFETELTPGEHRTAQKGGKLDFSPRR